MKILYMDWRMFGMKDIIEAFKRLGHTVDVCDIPLKHEKDFKKTDVEFRKYMQDKEYDCIFTSNFYPLVSDLCKEKNIKYISWVYDSPQVILYDKAIYNECNYVFIFDRSECNRLWNLGVKTVYYMPLAVNPVRLDNITITKKDREQFSSDVSLVASLYNEDHNFYDQMEPKLSDYTKGYLDGVMRVQKNLFGAFILEDALKNPDILLEMYKATPYDIKEGRMITHEYIYANYFLARKVASMQRIEYISEISKEFDMKVYTSGDVSAIKTVKNMGRVDYMTDMNKVFKLSKINLNITLPSIQTGIPLRIMDIMGNGGFLLTNYQEDMLEFFEPGVDFVYYTSLKEAKELIAYYLEHEEERKAIAENARIKMAENFSYEARLADMIYIVESAEK